MMPTEKAHSDIGASSLYRWAACPASVRLSRGIESKSSEYAEEGTLAHDIASKILLKQAIPPQELPADMMPAVMEYVDLILAEFAEDRHPDDVLLVEQRFHLSEIHPDAFGTADCVMFKAKSKTLKVYDYKHGKGHVVSVRGNPQLKYYALGALLSNKKLRPVTVESIIVQPRAFHEEGSTRREAYPVMEVLNFAADLVKFIKATEDPNAPVIAGDHCHFCNAKPHCPLLHEKALSAAKQEFNIQDAKISGYDVNKLSQTLDMLTAVEAYISGVREFAYSEAERGVDIPNYKLVAKRAQRKWTDQAQVGQRLAQRFNQTIIRDCQTSPELKSVAQIEKVVGKKLFNETLADLVVSISSGTTLVEDLDPRSPVSKSIGFVKQDMTGLLE
jgi:hypothetical protein